MRYVNYQGLFFGGISIVVCLASLASAQPAEGRMGVPPAQGRSAALNDGAEGCRVRLPEGKGAGETSTAAERALDAFDLSPAIFTENKGQWNESIRYAFNGKGINVFFTDDGPVFEVFGGSDGVEGKGRAAVIRARFIGANRTSPEALEPAGAKANYYIGNERGRWRSDAATFHKIRYPNVYDGIDLYCWGRRTGLKYEFHVSPGADWRKIRVAYEGASGLGVDASGVLRVGTILGDMVDDAPLAYQESAQGRVEVPCSFRLADESSYGFEVSGGYEETLKLVIDPDLAWSSYLGGGGGEDGFAVATDQAGNIYVAGMTDSSNFPAQGAYDTTHNGSSDAYVAKFSPSGGLLWATYLGGSDGENAVAIATYGTSVYVTGEVLSDDFPVTGVYDDSRNGSFDGYVAKFSSSGALVWSTYLGGSGSDEPEAITTDSTGTIYVGGRTHSANFPASGGYDSSFNGGYVDAFITKFSPAGALLWSSFFGGSGVDYLFALATDAFDNVYAGGQTQSADFPVAAGYDTTYADNDAFIMKLSPAGAMLWSTFLGTGTSSEAVYAIATDSVGDVYAAGGTSSSAFPASGGYDSTHNGEYDSTLTKFSAAGALVWATYFGGSSDELPKALAVDGADNVYIVGFTDSDDLPVYRAYDDTFNRTDIDNDAYAAKFSSSGGLLWSTYLGGGSHEIAYGVATTGSGTAYVTGYTYSTDFPVSGGYDSTYNGYGETFLVKFTEPAGPAEPIETPFLARRLQVRVNAKRPDSDRFMLKGSFNTTGHSVDWTAVDVTVGVGPYEETIPAGSFVTRNGVTFIYRAPKGTASGIVRALINAKTRTVVTSAMGLDLSAAGTDLDVTFEAGDFEGSFPLALNPRGIFTYGRTGEILTDVFMVDKASFLINPARPDKDRFIILGSAFHTEPLYLEAEDFTITVGGQSWTLPAGAFAKLGNGSLYRYRGPKGGQIPIVLVYPDKGTFRISGANLDLSALGQTVEISVSCGTFWGSATVEMEQKKNGFKY